MKFKAFIGPLGDDIPSIFPIVAGVLIFLLSIVFIQQQVVERNAQLDVRDQVLQLSYVVTEKGYMPAGPETDPSSFLAKCNVVKDLAQKRHIEFAMMLKPYCGPVDVEKFFVRTPAAGASEPQVCYSDKFENAISTLPLSQSLEFSSKNAVVMSFPMAVDCPAGNRGIGFISIAGWK